MKNILLEEEDTHIEPFRSILRLTKSFGHLSILEAFFLSYWNVSGSTSHCVKCYRKTELLYAGIGQLLRTYRREFPPKVELVGERHCPMRKHGK